MGLRGVTAFAVTLYAGNAGSAFAQTFSRKEPALYTSSERPSRAESRAPGIRLKLHQPREIALQPLSGAETARLAEPGTRKKAGLRRDLPADSQALGAWE